MAKSVKRAKGRRKRYRISIHRQYVIEEAARALGCCRATVKRMIKRGLPVISDRRPILILGEDISDFLRAGRKRHPCALDECFCFKCRKPRKPALGMADFKEISATGGNLTALCTVCGTVMNKRISGGRLIDLQAVLDVSIRQAALHLSDSDQPCLKEPLHEDQDRHA